MTEPVRDPLVMTEAEQMDLHDAWVEAREIAERSIRARQEAELALGTLQTALREVTLERDKANAAADRYCSQWIDVLKAAKSVVPAEAAVGTLQTALRQLVDKLDVILPIVDGYIALSHVRSGTQYAGPNIVAELAAVRALLPALEPTP